MLPRQRQAHILDRVRREGAVRVTALADELGVSDMTIRRDISSLAWRGLVERVHGGATLVHQRGAFEAGFETKVGLNPVEKDIIGRRAAREVTPGSVIGISAGTTTYALARYIVDIANLTIVTNSVPVSDHLAHHGRSDQTVILTGGVRTPSAALVGPLAIHAFRSVHLDVVFMGVHGMEPRSGFTTGNHLEADTDKALIASGRRLIVVADHSKWGTSGISSIASLDEASMVVTDGHLPAAARRKLEERTRVVVAEVNTHMEVATQ